MAKNKKKSHDNADHNGSVKKRSTKAVRRLITLAIIAVLILLGVESYRFAYRIANGSAVDDPPGKPVSVYIRDNMSPSDVADMLKDKGLLDGTLEFVVHAKLKGYTPSKYTGSHTLNTSMNAEQQLTELMIVNGER